jgi:hypothetical protein
MSGMPIKIFAVRRILVKPWHRMGGKIKTFHKETYDAYALD